MFRTLRNKRKWTADRLSRYILVAEVGIIALVFALFYLVGFDMPYVEDPDFNAPLLTDVLIGFMVLMLVVAIAVCFVVVGRRLRKQGKAQLVNGIRTARISWAIGLFLVVLLGVTFWLGSSDEMIINGTPYNNVFLLKLSDMFVDSCLWLLAVTAIVAVWGTFRKKKY